MSTIETTAERSRRRKGLLALLIATFLGILLIVFGANLALQRNIEQFAAAKVSAQIIQMEAYAAENFTEETTDIGAFLTTAVAAQDLDSTAIVIASKGSENRQTKVGSQAPSLAQSLLVASPDSRDTLLSPGEGKISNSSGEYYYRTVTLDFGTDTALFTAAQHLNDINELKSQTRTSSLLIGLGVFIVIALIASHFFSGPSKPTTTGSAPSADSPSIAGKIKRAMPAAAMTKSKDKEKDKGTDNSKNGQPPKKGPTRVSSVFSDFNNAARSEATGSTAARKGTYSTEEVPEVRPAPQSKPKVQPATRPAAPVAPSNETGSSQPAPSATTADDPYADDGTGPYDDASPFDADDLNAADLNAADLDHQVPEPDLEIGSPTAETPEHIEEIRASEFREKKD